MFSKLPTIAALAAATLVVGMSSATAAVSASVVAPVVILNASVVMACSVDMAHDNPLYGSAGNCHNPLFEHN